MFLGDLGDLGGLEWTDEVFQCLVAIWKFIGLEDSGRSIGRNSLSMKGYLSKRSFFDNGALQRRLSSRCFTPSLSLFLPEPAVFLVARRSPAFSGKVIFLEIFTSLSTSVAISKSWVNNYIVAAVGHTLSACNSCCKSSRMVLALAIITHNVTKIGMFAKMCRKITKGHVIRSDLLYVGVFIWPECREPASLNCRCDT